MGTTILSNGKGHFGPTDRNDQIGQSGPPSKLVSNIEVGPNRNGPFHLMYQPKFPEFLVEWKGPQVILQFNLNALLKINEFKLKLTYRSVFPFCYCLTGSLKFPSSTVKQTSERTPIFEMFFTFFTRKTLRGKCLRSGAARCKHLQKAGILARNSHTFVASDWTYHFSHT